MPYHFHKMSFAGANLQRAYFFLRGTFWPYVCPCGLGIVKTQNKTGKSVTSNALPLRKEDPCMNQKEPFLRRILPYLLNENSHMGLFGPLYLLWHCEYQTCLR